MFKEIYKKHRYSVYLLETEKSCYQIMLKDERNIVAIYYVSNGGVVFGFFPIEYTYASADFYNEILQEAIKVLLGKGE